MRSEFDTWLRENSYARDCEHHLARGLCSKSEKIMRHYADELPMLDFRCDGAASAEQCQWWESESAWRDRMYADWQSTLLEHTSAAAHRAAVSSVKGFEV